jgi:hypothetical protein
MPLYSRVLIISGLNTKVVEGFKKYLTAQQIFPVFCNLSSSDQYFLTLTDRTLQVLQKYKNGDKLYCLLASCVDHQNEHIEQAAFFPALRRQKVFFETRSPSSSEYANKAEMLAKQFKSLESQSANLKKFHKGCLFLPVVNTGSGKLKADLLRLFLDVDAAPSQNLCREFIIDHSQKSPALRSKNNNLIFLKANNNPKHPIRRVSTTSKCDLLAHLRLGLPVGQRFEYDVTKRAGRLEGKFAVCEGTKTLNGEATHLNMRINDDFLS